MQVKLLRVLDGVGYTPLGGLKTKKSDFRVIAATNRDLVKLVKDGQMREDFFYRIRILPVQLPPLRERREDIPLLIDHFLSTLNKGENPPNTCLSGSGRPWRHTTGPAMSANCKMCCTPM
jgi:transcriptional regulator with PAS, ATPase and Fis domain